MLQGGFAGPAVGLQRGDLRRGRIGSREVGQNMQRGVAVAGGRGQLDRDPVDDKGCARVRLRQTESLVIERSPLRVVPDPAAGAWGWSDHVRGRGERSMTKLSV